MKANKIFIIGISGTGKTRLAKKLSAFLKIPATYCDQLIWKENWEEEDEKIVEQKLEAVLKKEKWIIEGFIHPSAKNKMKNADMIIYLDYSGFEAVLGGLNRWWQYRGRTRPELATGCIEKIDLNFLKVMWKRGERPEIEDVIKGFEKKIIRLKTRRKTNDFLAKLVNK